MARENDPTREEALADIRRMRQEMREKFQSAPKANQWAVRLLLITIATWIAVGILIAVGG